jgi:hypothetical protein
MALAKRVRDEGHGFYKGYKLTVLAAAGDYTLDMTITDTGCAVNGITVIIDTYGASDYFKLEHLDASNVGYGMNDGVIGETIYNTGANSTYEFDFPELRLMESGHKFRLTYTSVAATALNVYTIVERLK